MPYGPFISKLFIIITALVLSGLMTSDGFAAGVLNGGVTQEIYLAPGSSNGYVVAGSDHQPVHGATVSVPDLGIQTTTGVDGSFSFRGLPQGKRLIMNVSKVGFLPENAVLETDPSLNRPLEITLREVGATLIIDPNLHHLGDNSYSPYSAAAGQFRKQASGATLARRFRLSEIPQGSRPLLQIGVIMGLDTLQAHRAGQSSANAFSSPVKVRMNGYDIGYLTVNGLKQQVPIPPALLRPNGDNLLEVEAGHHRPDGVRIDYDDMELMNLILIL